MVLALSSSSFANTATLEPIRKGTLLYTVQENSFSRSADSRTVTSRHQEVCKGEMKIPVFDLTGNHSGTMFSPERVKCKVLTDSGPMDVTLGSYVDLIDMMSLSEKTATPKKILNISFGLTEGDESGQRKNVSNNYFSSRTRDLKLDSLFLQAQTETMITKPGPNDVPNGVTDSFSITAEFVDAP
jgi:hypothetical protein